jgi:alpha-mannosidase
MLDEAVRLQSPSSAFPKFSFGTARGFFDDLQKSVDRGEVKPPVWDDELYLEYHRGCYTTQSETKKQIRSDEELLQTAEKFAALSFLARRPYPQREFEETWKKVLFDHFHDIMPGSGVAVNYLDALRNLREAGLEGEKILRGSLEDIAARVNTQGPGVPVAIFNPLSWERTGAVVLEAPWSGPGGRLEARDSAGRLLPSQVISADADARRVRLLVQVPRVPPLGYEVIRLAPAADARPAPSALKVSWPELENEFLRVRIDPQTGCVTSLVSKADGRETIAPGACGNLLQTFVDRPPRQDAWEIKFDEKFWDLKQPEEVKLVESGPARAVVRVRHKFQNSTFVQDIILSAGVPRVDVETRAEWHEHHVLLKVAVPVNVGTDFATFEIPYGTIRRPTTRNTPAERAKFEVPALRWGDLSDADHGLSLLNASKYGYDAKGNVIRLSLLRSATYPLAREDDPRGVTDQGTHEFTYALYPHRGDWKAGDTMRQGYELNYPLIPLTTQAHGGPLPARYSFARIEPGDVILAVVKKAEDEDALIFRFYEFAGERGQVRLQLPERAVGAFETNLMEGEERRLALGADGRELSIPTGPYEIKTVKVSFASGGGGRPPSSRR